MMHAGEFVRRVVDVAKNHKTLYVLGCFGAPMTARNKARYRDNNDFNRAAARRRMIDVATEDTFGFDCVCLIKGILWGWSADQGKNYGGAIYKSNGVPDIGADQMIRVCSEVSTNFTGIVPGAAVWMPGHIGVYIGDGLAVECTPKWANCVQITAVGNMGKKAGYNTRTWKKWGKLPYIDYTAETAEVSDMTKEDVQKMIDQAMDKLRAELVPKVYRTVEDVPEWGRPMVDKLMAAGKLKGTGDGAINLSHDLLRALVIMERGETQEKE